MISATHIQEILDDKEFQKLRQRIKDDLVKTILAATTKDDNRTAKLAEYHALERLEAIMHKASKGITNG